MDCATSQSNRPAFRLFPSERPAGAKKMPADADRARVASPSAAAPELPAADLLVVDARASPLSAAASPAPNPALEAEISVEKSSALIDGDSGPATPSAVDQEPELASAEAAKVKSVDVKRVCVGCGFGSEDSGDHLFVCADCGIAVHGRCYFDGNEHNKQPANLEGVSATGSYWKCDCCAHGVVPDALQCVYCGKVGDGAMRMIDTDCALWQSLLPEQDDAQRALHFGHLLCASWDPRRVEIRDDPKLSEPRDEAAENDVGMDSAVSAPPPKPVPAQLNQRSLLAPEDCCFCGSASGVRIQCRRLDCARFFHAMCASESAYGYLERTNAGAISQYHAYCNRHRGCREDVVSLLEKLASKPISSLIGREDARKLHILLKHTSTYTNIEALLSEIAETLVGLCKKGLQTSKSIPPTYIVKHLQVLQFFLGYVPQLEVVYNVPHIPIKDRIGDLKLYKHLAKTFNPSRFISRYPGPLSQLHSCVVCLEPFLERQHLLYCSHATEPHLQHWMCTTREHISSAKDRNPASSGKKRKKHSAALNGTSAGSQHPAGATTAVDKLTCSVCAAPMDLRGLTSLPANPPGSHLGQRPSMFVDNGRFINTIPTMTLSAASRPSSNRSLGVLPVPAADTTKTVSGPPGEVTSTTELAPLKLEKINVQRTAKWLSCVAQIIRLAGRAQTTVDPLDVEASQQEPAQGIPVDKEVCTPEPVASPVVVEMPGAPTEANALKDGEELSNGAPMMSLSTSEVTAPAESQANASDTPSLATTGSDSAANQSVETPKAQTKDEVQVYFDEAIRIIGTFDPYALNRVETARDMLARRSGPAVAVLRMLAQEYTQFIHAKHVRAVEKVRAEKRKREELEAQKRRELERKRLDREAELALKKKMLAMRKKQRTGLFDQA